MMTNLVLRRMRRSANQERRFSSNVCKVVLLLALFWCCVSAKADVTRDWRFDQTERPSYVVTPSADTLIVTSAFLCPYWVEALTTGVLPPLGIVLIVR